ncbi:tripartite motif containing 105 [Salminus brasiliensis]|uniref:tripartite motif containing 105 n=1 Tax=Salminus brasiliensis TaxID=930266 RepID=UPI003B833333
MATSTSSSSSAVSKATLREDLTCAICYDLFTEPVMLACMHHFCKRCITTYWRSLRGPVSCPQCRQEFPNKHFQTNYLVAGLVEKVKATSSTGYLKNLEKKLKDRMDSQKSRKEEIITMIRKDEEQMDTIRKVGVELRHRVCSDFQALHHFLQVEEAAVLEQLQRDQEVLEQSLVRHLEALHTAVRDLEENLNAIQQAASTMSCSVLVELPEFNSSFRPQLQAVRISDIGEFSSKYIAPLQYTMWRKMFHSLKPGPLPLTFDEDTVHPSLLLSPDRTQVVEKDGILNYKPNPKRFVQCVNVLAAQGFQTGRHYWEVSVGTKPKWDLGVALETVDRQARVKLCPENGYWTLRLRNGHDYSAGTQPWTSLPMTSRPRRIGVFVDCKERRVSFYNADDMRLLYSFSNGPRAKAFPFFSTCLSEPGQQAQPIRLLHFPIQSP